MVGSQQMYVDYYTREMIKEGDGISILCADNSDSVVKDTLPDDNCQIFSSEYRLLELRRELDSTKKMNRCYCVYQKCKTA